MDPSTSASWFKLPLVAGDAVEPMAPGLTLAGVDDVPLLLLPLDVGMGTMAMPATSLAPSVPGDGPLLGVGVGVLCAFVSVTNSAATRTAEDRTELFILGVYLCVLCLACWRCGFWSEIGGQPWTALTFPMRCRPSLQHWVEDLIDTGASSRSSTEKEGFRKPRSLHI